MSYSSLYPLVSCLPRHCFLSNRGKSPKRISVKGKKSSNFLILTSSCLPFLKVSVSTDTKRLVAATTVGAVTLLFLARHFQRRKGRKKAISPQWEQASIEFFSSASALNGTTSCHWHISSLFFSLLNQQLTGLLSPFSVLAQLLVCYVIRVTCLRLCYLEL